MATCPAWVAAAEESSSQVVHRIVRNIWYVHLFENELLEVIVRFLSSHAVSVANHRGDGVDDRLRDGASNFGWKPPEVISLFRPEGNRVIAVMVDPIAGPDLTILTLTRRNMISFWRKMARPWMANITKQTSTS